MQAMAGAAGNWGVAVQRAMGAARAVTEQREVVGQRRAAAAEEVAARGEREAVLTAVAAVATVGTTVVHLQEYWVAAGAAP